MANRVPSLQREQRTEDGVSWIGLTALALTVAEVSQSGCRNSPIVLGEVPSIAAVTLVP